MLDIDLCRNTLIEGVRFQNAPEYHLSVLGALNLTIRDMSILVNVSEAPYPYSLPTFPLNTDGIDVSGRDVVIRNLYVENYDDGKAQRGLFLVSLIGLKLKF